MKFVRRIIGTLCFLILFYYAFTGMTNLMMHKQVEGKWDMTAKVAGFYNEKPNRFDVLFFGSSHMYCSVDPRLVQEQTDLRSYVFATQKQPLWITYYYIQEALKTQNPKVLCVEVHMAASSLLYADEATNHTAIDPIPFSENKIRMIYDAIPEGQRRYYLFSIMKYHDRWEEIKREDYIRSYEKQTDWEHGYVRLKEAATDIEVPDLTDFNPTPRITDKNREYLNKMIDLAQEENIELILFKAPSNATRHQEICYRAVEQIAKERGIAYIDYNTPELYETLGLDPATDFYDKHHLNESGMTKFVTDFNSRFLKNEAIDETVVKQVQ